VIERRNSDAPRRVTLSDLKIYLDQSGWRRLPSRESRWITYELTTEGAQGLELLLPAEESYIDTAERIQDALAVISQIENRNQISVARDLLSVNADSIAFRLEVANDSGSIPIADAARHVKAIRNLLQFGYCSELEPRRHFEDPIPAAIGMLQNFSFCHTFRGSFGFEVTNAIEKTQKTGDLFSSPTQRKVVERIARGAVLLESAVAADDPNILIGAYETALNARMCDALSEVGLDGQIKFDLDFTWARVLSPSHDVKDASTFRIAEPQVQILRFASEQLKIVEPRADRIVGQVVNLHCVTDPADGSARRTIALKVSHSEFGNIEVKLALGSEAYLVAIEAHSKGQKLVASGQLQRKGSTWSLEAVTLVDVAPDP
jgi:hypothetical protein